MILESTDQPWAEAFTQEKARILVRLGEITAGGIVEAVQHIGATSVPGLLTAPCVDIGLAVWPFPLTPLHQTALEDLGYELVPGHEGAPEQRLQHASAAFQLYLVDPGGGRWLDFVIMRDYLRQHDGVRQVFSAQKQIWVSQHGLGSSVYQASKTAWLERTLPEARQWWVAQHGFSRVEQVAEELKEFDQPWHIASGWALDLFVGRVTRVHHDIDVEVPFTAQLSLQRYMLDRGWQWVTPLQGRLEPWPPHMRLELPRHQAHAHRNGDFIDFLLTPIEQGVWRYRRTPTIIRAVESIGLRTDRGIPYLAPELALLYKSRNTSNQERSKDQADFETVYPLLDAERRAWLRWALLVTQPDHPWVNRLAQA